MIPRPICGNQNTIISAIVPEQISDTVTFIEAEGDGLTYQRLCCAPGASSFEYLTGSNATSSTLRVEMTAESNGAEYRCFITNSAGEMASTRIATVKLDILDWTMEYDTSGQRTKRISDEKTYTYIYAGDKLMRMTVGDDVLDFSYDASGAPLTMTYNGTVYYYITNLQGDVTSLQQANGNTGAQYAYDAWGNIIAMQGDLAELNPLRYRGYVYDQETGFYYLNSRYYDPEIGRFINADGYVSTGKGIIGFHMFAYCGNNPVIGYDPTGDVNWLGVGIGIGLALTGIAVVAATVASGGTALPVITAAAKCVAYAVGLGITATGITTTYTAATEETLVLDVAVSDGQTHNKQGYSVVVDFESDSMGIETYYHFGKTTSGYGASYGTGIVAGYSEPGDYGGYFADAGITLSNKLVEYGVDICTDPSAPFSKCSAILAVVGVSFPNNSQGKVSGYAGVDYYIPISVIKWEH